MTTAVSQILNHYNDLGQLTAQYQSNTTVVSPLYPPVQVDYFFTDLGE